MVLTGNSNTISAKSKITYISFKEAHLPALLFVSNHLFGQDYYSAQDFIDMNEQSILRVAIMENSIVGFFVVKVKTKSEANYLDELSSDNILEVKTIGVHPDFQRRGIGTHIFSEVVRLSTELNVSECYCVAWDRKGVVAMHQIHIYAGFKIIKKISNYWKEDSIQKGYNCPDCGNPCVCNVVIYVKEVN